MTTVDVAGIERWLLLAPPPEQSAWGKLDGSSSSKHLLQQREGKGHLCVSEAQSDSPQDTAAGAA